MFKKILPFVVLVIVIVLGWYSYTRFSPEFSRVCTEEAKVCPDGSAVGRTGPNCEFAECPNVLVGDDGPGVMCTADAKICPDGTGVGRVGPDCEFAPCPPGEFGI